MGLFFFVATPLAILVLYRREFIEGKAFRGRFAVKEVVETRAFSACHEERALTMAKLFVASTLATFPSSRTAFARFVLNADSIFLRLYQIHDQYDPNYSGAVERPHL